MFEFSGERNGGCEEVNDAVVGVERDLKVAFQVL